MFNRQKLMRLCAHYLMLAVVLIGVPYVCCLLSGKDDIWTLVFRFGIAALICGICWETWNYWSFAKWIYAVPYVHRFQIWEMPVLGFGGYLPFGMECAAVAAWMSRALVVWKGGAE